MKRTGSLTGTVMRAMTAIAAGSIISPPIQALRGQGIGAALKAIEAWLAQAKPLADDE